MTGENGPPIDGWAVDPHGCPFELADCPICKGRAVSDQIPTNVILGTE